MQKTEYLELNLPEGDDYYNVEDFNENAEKIDETIHEMKETFQAGVEACYNACVTKGSTPISHALGDVVNGILAIESGGDPYSMFPQEVSGRKAEGCSEIYLSLNNNTDILTATIIIDSEELVKVNFTAFIKSYYTGTLSFSLVIDNTTIIPNIASLVISETDTKYDFSFSYTLTTPLTNGYHTLTLRSNTSSGLYYAIAEWPMCNFYGFGFVAAQYPGIYFSNGTFMQFIPSNFIAPTNPISYNLDYESSGMCGGLETIEDAMNHNYSDTFDSGVCYNMKGITPYWVWDEDVGDYVPVFPEILDTYVYSNGKFAYHHLTSRSFNDDVFEDHYFVLPVIANFYTFFNYINIRCKMAVRDSSLSGKLKLFILNRENQSEVETGSSEEYYIDSYYQGDEFIVSLNIEGAVQNGISFIGIGIIDIETSSDEFTFEIDKIWGSSTRQDESY